MIIKGNNVKISSIDGKHGDGKSNADVECFKIFKQKVKFLPTGIKKFFPLLKELIVNVSKLEVIERKSFDNMSTLEAVQMATNKISSIPEDSFYDLIELKVLWLGFNKLKSLPSRLLVQQEMLEVFNIRNNEINEIPKGFFKNNLELKTIRMENNNLSIIDTFDMFNMEKLDQVALKGNKCIKRIFEEIKQSDLNEIKRKCSKKIKKGKASMMNMNLFLFLAALMIIYFVV
jgi:Leucine-rich repeat (LRR) protein